MDSGRLEFVDILFEASDGVATVTINRPEVRNAFRPETVDELMRAIDMAWRDQSIGVVVLTGAGDKAFCAGGDLSGKTDDGYGGDARSNIGIDTFSLYSMIRDIPKPVIAAVNGFAIGGGHVLHVVCDLTIAAESSVFGQVGPRVGSADVGFGTGVLAGVVGEKRAKEIWYLCRRYTAQEALAMGLVNEVVPDSQLRARTAEVTSELLQMSPTALAFLKTAFTAASENLRGLSALGMLGVGLYYGTPESQEGARAFLEKRQPHYRRPRTGIA